MPKQETFFHWQNKSSNTAGVSKNWFVAEIIQKILHPFYSSDLAPMDLFLIQDRKERLAVLSLVIDNHNTSLNMGREIHRLTNDRRRQTAIISEMSGTP
jgi:hypothetical protein